MIFAPGDGPARVGDMVELYSPEGEPQLAVLKSVFDDAGIRYHVFNDAFGSLLAGPRIALFNRKKILVDERHLDEARALLSAFLERTADPPRAVRRQPYSALDKVRMVLEFLVFGWFLPGRRTSKAPHLRLVKGHRDRPVGSSPAQPDRPSRPD